MPKAAYQRQTGEEQRGRIPSASTSGSGGFLHCGSHGRLHADMVPCLLQLPLASLGRGAVSLGLLTVPPLRDGSDNTGHDAFDEGAQELLHYLLSMPSRSLALSATKAEA